MAEPRPSYCLASRLILENGAPIGLMYRERPFSNEDSGWRLFEGAEDGAFAADPRNILMVPLGRVLQIHAEIAGLLEAPPGSAFERDESGRLEAAGRQEPT